MGNGIADIEKRLEQGDCSEQTIEQFKTALKRVPKYNRCQHCYTTAAAMPPRFHKEAAGLIQYGMDFCDSPIDRMRSYNNLAIISERSGDYTGALESYKKLLAALEPNDRDLYAPEYAAHMMRVEMHITDFKYSEALLDYYNIAVRGSDQKFLWQMFYRAVAEIIIFDRQGDPTGAKRAFDAAAAMLRPEHAGPMTGLLKSKGFNETAGATEQVIAFLGKIAGSFYPHGTQGE